MSEFNSLHIIHDNDKNKDQDQDQDQDQYHNQSRSSECDDILCQEHILEYLNHSMGMLI
jgi:hypothetical protein